MKIVSTLPELWQTRQELSGSVGFVPTMGFLHDGHISLVRAAKSMCDNTIVSIFVNPTQFSPNEDLDAYPRDLPRDFAMLEEAGVDLVWTPTPEIMYPDDFQTWVEVIEVTKPLEGNMRPNHFRGVTTVVAKLFNAVWPQKAFFGQKDAQQAIVIQQMTRDLNYPIEIVICPIRREDDGLAMSSRNTYLDEHQRRAAPILFHALSVAKEAFEKGERNAKELRQIVTHIVTSEPLTQLQYISCTHPKTLAELDTIGPEGALLSMAVYFGTTRLIDNIILKESITSSKQ
jgi:pantoate--beta-alanine ligase